MAEKKPHINLIFIGHVDQGKSTTLGRMFVDMGLVSERELEEYKKQAQEFKKAGWEFAYVVDKSVEERKRGLTIDLFHKDFETKKYYFTVIDAPGHRDFIKNMITGASQADAAVLVVSAKPNEFETAMGPDGQGKEHVLLAKMVGGVKQFIVFVNKMDAVNYDQATFEKEKQFLEKFFKNLGITPIAIIPGSGLMGDNVVKKSDKMPWYNGPTLAEALDMLQPPEQPIDKPLRIPIEDVFSIKGVGTVPVGRVLTGVLRVGDRVVFKPSNVSGEVKSIEMHHTPMQEAKPGDNIGFNVKGVGKGDVKRGDVTGKVGEKEPTVAKEIIAQIYVVWHPTAVAAGYTPVMHVHTAHAPVRFEELIEKIDPRTGQKLEDHPQFLKVGDAAKVKLVPLKPIVLEPINEIPQMARFAIRDMGKTVAVGVALQVTPAE